MKLYGFAASSANTTATGELGGLFLPLAVGYRPDAYTSAGFSKATYATYDEASNPYINKVMVTPPTLGTPCRVATTGAITLSGLQTVDGIALALGDRVLVKDQSTATQNGIYTVKSGSWARPFDSDTGTEILNTHRELFLITLGTANGGYYAALRVTGTITLGTTAINYDLVLDPVLLESQTVYFLRFKEFPTGAQWYATDNDTNPINPKLATTSNITLSGLPVIDGVQTVVFNYVLVKNQTTLSENGLYTVRTGAWDFIDFDISKPWLIYVSSGTVNGGRTFASSRTVAYTPFAVFTNVYTLVSMILYPTLADASAETNALIPAYKTAFNVEWITRPYTPIACVEMAAVDVEDIYCCPAPTEYLQTFPDHVKIILEADPAFSGVEGETILLTMFTDGDYFYGGSGSSISTYNSAEYTPLLGIYFWFTEYSYPICSGTPKKTTIRSVSWVNNYDLDYTQNVIYRYQTASYADLCDVYPSHYWQGWRYAAADYQALPQGYEMTGSSISSRVATNTPRILSVELKSAQTIPPTISCYLIDAVFQRTTVDIPSGDDIAIGTISVTLTYDAASSTYYGPVANYFNIPGRLSMPIGILATVASGNQFLEVTNPNWKVNSSNQIYYEKYLSAGAPSNTITLFYSSYSDARKPQASTLNFYKTNSFSVYTATNGSLMRSDPATQTATP